MPGTRLNFDKPEDKCLFLVNRIGILKQIPCPFPASSKMTIENLRAGIPAYVDKVESDKQGNLVYVIKGEYYSYDMFELRDVAY